MRRELLITTVASIAGVLFGGAARAADPAPAAEDQRPNAALVACASGDVAKGISILGQLYAETRSPSYVFNQGRCYQKNNQLEQARNSFAEYLRIGTSEPPEDLQRAQAFVKEIDDELAVQHARQAAAAQAPAPVVVVAPSAEDGRRHSLRVTSVVLASVGVAAIAAGAYLSLKVRQTNNDINQEFAGMNYVTDVGHLQQQLSDGQRYETWQWVGYGLGVAALAGAATTFILSGGMAGAGSTSAEHASLAVAPALSPDGVGGVLRMRF